MAGWGGQQGPRRRRCAPFANQAVLTLSQRRVLPSSKLVCFVLTQMPCQDGTSQKKVQWGRDGCRLSPARVKARVEAEYWKTYHEPWAFGEVRHTLGFGMPQLLPRSAAETERESQG